MSVRPHVWNLLEGFQLNLVKESSYRCRVHVDRVYSFFFVMTHRAKKIDLMQFRSNYIFRLFGVNSNLLKAKSERDLVKHFIAIFVCLFNIY